MKTLCWRDADRYKLLQKPAVHQWTKSTNMKGAAYFDSIVMHDEQVVTQHVN
jgi:hypothetical protein